MATPTTLPSTFVAGNVLQAAQLNDLRGAFRVLQVISTAKTNTFSSSSTTYVDVTDLSVTITPSATSSKILVFADVKLSNSNATAVRNSFFRLMRNTTAIYIGDASGAIDQATHGQVITSNTIYSTNGIFLDSPATTSSTTYKVQARCTADAVQINFGGGETNSNAFARTASSITVMEISA